MHARRVDAQRRQRPRLLRRQQRGRLQSADGDPQFGRLSAAELSGQSQRWLSRCAVAGDQFGRHDRRLPQRVRGQPRRQRGQLAQLLLGRIRDAADLSKLGRHLLQCVCGLAPMLTGQASSSSPARTLMPTRMMRARARPSSRVRPRGRPPTRSTFAARRRSHRQADQAPASHRARPPRCLDPVAEDRRGQRARRRRARPHRGHQASGRARARARGFDRCGQGHVGVADRDCALMAARTKAAQLLSAQCSQFRVLPGADPLMPSFRSLLSCARLRTRRSNWWPIATSQQVFGSDALCAGSLDADATTCPSRRATAA